MALGRWGFRGVHTLESVARAREMLLSPRKAGQGLGRCLEAMPRLVWDPVQQYPAGTAWVVGRFPEVSLAGTGLVRPARAHTMTGKAEPKNTWVSEIPEEHRTPSHRVIGSPCAIPTVTALDRSVLLSCLRPMVVWGTRA